MAKCSFCEKELSQGTGTMYVKKDGKVFWFCSKKCEKNSIKLNRKPVKIRWTEQHRKEKAKAKK